MTFESMWTVGHSTLAAPAFIALLHEHGIEQLMDVRRFPASRRHPHFSRETLEQTLLHEGIVYVWLPELGGRRPARKDSHNTAWRNSSFRGYADYMETEPFALAVAQLAQLAHQKRTAIMCAERAWQQCHRGLIADFLKADGMRVVHILAPGRSETHPWTAAARIVDGKLSYADELHTQQALGL